MNKRALVVGGLALAVTAGIVARDQGSGQGRCRRLHRTRPVARRHQPGPRDPAGARADDRDAPRAIGQHRGPSDQSDGLGPGQHGAGRVHHGVRDGELQDFLAEGARRCRQRHYRAARIARHVRVSCGHLARAADERRPAAAMARAALEGADADHARRLLGGGVAGHRDLLLLVREHRAAWASLAFAGKHAHDCGLRSYSPAAAPWRARSAKASYRPWSSAP